MFSRAAAALSALFLLSACGTTMKLEDFRSTTPTLQLEDYFEGSSKAWGLFEDRFGNVRTQFWVDIQGTWDGTTLVLDEDFLYANGDTEQRTWTIVKTGPNTYEGEAENVIGVATGETSGNAFNWRYDFNLDVGDGDIWKVHFDDWMFLQKDGILLNKARVKRWGFTIGTVFISFTKDPAKAESPVAYNDPANEAGNRDTIAGAIRKSAEQ